MVYKVNQFWLAGLNDEEREKMTNLVVSNTILLDKLRKMLYNMKEGKENTVLSDYDVPSWSHKQAHLNGEQAAITKIIDLIAVTEREDPPVL